MSGIDEFKATLRGEVEAAREKVEAMQAESAEQYRRMQARYATFLDLSQRIRDAVKPRLEAFAETLPGATPTVTRRDFGPAGRTFHAVIVSFDLPRSERCPAEINLRLALEAGPAVEGLVLSYDLRIMPVFLDFERHDQLALPLEEASVERALDWFDRKAVQFTRTYISLFFNASYQRGSDVVDPVLGMSFPRTFARGTAEHEGTTYHFFTEESREAFEREPAKYLGSHTIA
ncbi:YHS domain-containing protein [Tautonia plasticadhaerens]|uniref:YHS domain protein n=1 Tax=Tautonia plasticadhaerens TaxID=2527974 RepID=A0A518H1M5_9BACT|nr:YHS domain-containing protein [Tautonia plasticadhaerens]QDV34745.1 YHS domain protein [Tautonia plasticadhaerens]